MKKILLATSNIGKVREIREFLVGFEVVALSEVFEPFEIVEDGESFKENALIKARAVFARLREIGRAGEFFVLSDDSGISVEALGGEPGIFSARYSGEGATDASNRAKLIKRLASVGVSESRAFYTAAMALVSEAGEWCVHGFMHGRTICEERGENGFGYDFLFVPNGEKRTIGEMQKHEKEAISHRTKALELVKILLKTLR